MAGYVVGGEDGVLAGRQHHLGHRGVFQGAEHRPGLPVFEAQHRCCVGPDGAAVRGGRHPAAPVGAAQTADEGRHPLPHLGPGLAGAPPPEVAAVVVVSVEAAGGPQVLPPLPLPTAQVDLLQLGGRGGRPAEGDLGGGRRPPQRRGEHLVDLPDPAAQQLRLAPPFGMKAPVALPLRPALQVGLGRPVADQLHQHR